MIYYADEIGMTGAGDPDNRRDMGCGDQVIDREKSVLGNFRKLTELRRAHPALRYGSRRTLFKDNECLAFVRAYFDDRVLVVLNRANSERQVTLDTPIEVSGGNLVDFRTGKKIRLEDDKLTMTVPPMSALFPTLATDLP